MAHSNDTKAAVMAALLAGQSIPTVAKEYELPTSTVGRWYQEAGLGNGSNGNNGNNGVNREVKKEIGDLILGYLRNALLTLDAQLKVFGNEDWLSKQDASEVAVLHGVIADKGIRLLEALSGDEDEDKPGS